MQKELVRNEKEDDVELHDNGNDVGNNPKKAVRMSTPARKRLMRDFKRLQQDPPAGISGAPQDNNIMLWNAVIFGGFAGLMTPHGMEVRLN
ncbi:hypothetical protein V6N13_017083 [Hibiscus sabdariffa]